MEDILWIVFCDPHNTLTHTDKYVVMIVRDCDILAYQRHLAGSVGTINELVRNMNHLQPFVYVNGLHYYIRRYVPWSSSQ